MNSAATAFLPDLDPEEIRTRIAWARKRGLPRWLWPDIQPQHWRAALSEIARALTHILTDEPSVARLDGDPRVLSLAAYTSGTGPLLGFFVERGNLLAAPAISGMLAAHLSHNRKRMEMLRREAITATRLLAEEGIVPIVPKGMHTAFAYFPEPGCRPVSDIDLIVKPEELTRAEDIFRAHGYAGTVMSQVPYQCDWTRAGGRTAPHSLLHVHADDPWSIDLQTTIDRHLRNVAIVYLDRFVSNDQLAVWPLSETARVLKQPLLLVVLAAHASQHLINLSLGRIVELAFVARADQASGALDWDAFLRMAREAGPRYLYPAIYACERLVPGTIPSPVLQACEADAPVELRRLFAKRDVALLQPLDHHSFEERYMWFGGWWNRLRRVVREIDPGPADRTPRKAFTVYLNRLRAVRHTFAK
jgi:hypothetical protein